MSEIESPIKVDISKSANKTLEALCFPAAEQAGKTIGNIIGLIKGTSKNRVKLQIIL